MWLIAALLDGKEVSDTTRDFVKCLMKNRASQQLLETASKEKELKILPAVSDIDSKLYYIMLNEWSYCNLSDGRQL